MKGKTSYFTGHVIKYVPKENMYRDHNLTNVFNAVKYLNDNDIIAIKRNICQKTGLGPTAVKKHLNSLTKSNNITEKFVKMQFDVSVTITAIYSVTKKSKKNT
jgi:SOS response regulatory protein OraA/RecX